MSKLEEICEQMKIVAHENPFAQSPQNPVVPDICCRKIRIEEEVYIVILSENVFTVKPGMTFKFRLLSISNQDERSLPSDDITQMIIKAFHFKNYTEQTDKIPRPFRRFQRQYVVMDPL